MAIVEPYAGSVLSSRPLPLEPIRPGKWNSWFRLLPHLWRYGYLHPDEDLIGVIDAVGDYLGVQVATAKAVLSGAKLSAVEEIEKELKAELTSMLPDFSNLLAIEARLQALYPPVLARRRRWLLQERFNRVAASGAREAWAQDPPAGLETSGVQLEGAAESLRHARLKQDQAAAANAAAAEARAAKAKAVEETLASLRAADPAFDPVAEEARLATLPPDGDEATALRERLAPLEAARGELEAASRAEEVASAAATQAREATREAEATCLLAEAQHAAARAKADLVRKSAKVDAARAAAEGFAQGSAERADADRALEAAESDRRAASRVADDKVAAAAKLEQETRRGGASGGGGADGGGGAGGSSGAGDSAPLTEEAADQLTLLNYIHSHYLLTISREKAIRDLKRWLIMRFWRYMLLLGLTLLLASAVLYVVMNDSMGRYWAQWQLFLGLVTVAAVGRAGATMSIARRLQAAVNANVQESDPIIELTALRTGKNDISLALLSSSIFALLLYAFFLTGVPRMMGFQQGIFPETTAAAPQAAGSGTADGGGTGEARNPGSAEGADRSAGTEIDTATENDQEADRADAAGTDQQRSAGPNEGAGTPASADAPADRPAPDAPAAAPQPAAPADPAVAFAQAERGSERSMAAALAALEAAVEAQSATLAAAERRLAEARERPLSQAAIEAATIDRDYARSRLDDLKQRLELDSRAQARADEQQKARRCRAGEACMPFNQMAAALGLASLADFFKLLLWAFIAGFAERFVPDVLDRIVSRARPQPVVVPARSAAAAPPPDPGGAGGHGQPTG